MTGEIDLVGDIGEILLTEEQIMQLIAYLKSLAAAPTTEAHAQ